MGQGLHTKVAQVAASAFNIPLSSVFISETSTDKVIRNLMFERFLFPFAELSCPVDHIQEKSKIVLIGGKFCLNIVLLAKYHKEQT